MKAPSHERGYTYAWSRLSKRAREIQPWCSDCGTAGEPGNPLTLDHTPAAWAKISAGKQLTLKDAAKGLVVVRCMECNNRQGPARGCRTTRD